MELIRRDYVANGGWETFLSYEDPKQGRERGGGERERSAVMICASGSVTAPQTTPIAIISGGRGKMIKCTGAI